MYRLVPESSEGTLSRLYNVDVKGMVMVNPGITVQRDAFFVGGSADEPRIGADLWRLFYELDVEDDDAVQRFSADFGIFERKSLRPAVARTRRVHRQLRPITETILAGGVLSEIQWEVLNSWLAKAVHQRRQECLGNSGDPPAVRVQRRVVTHDLFAVVVAQLVAEYEVGLAKTPLGQNREDYRRCPICQEFFHERARRGQVSHACSTACSYALKRRRQREKRARARSV